MSNALMRRVSLSGTRARASVETSLMKKGIALAPQIELELEVRCQTTDAHRLDDGSAASSATCKHVDCFTGAFTVDAMLT